MLRKIIFLNSNSRAVYLPEKADVIISECIGYYVLGGDMISAVVQIRDRFLKKGGGVIPRSISMFLAPVSSPTHSKYLNFWSKKLLYGINFSPVQEMVRNNVYSTIMDKADLIAGPKKIYTIDLSRDTPNEMFSATADFLISRSGYMNGVCGWFDVDLCNGINFSTSPYGKPTVWRQAFFPIDETPVKKYDTARVDLILKRTGDDSCSCFSWSIKIISSQGARRRIVRQYSTKMSFPFNHRKICSQKRCDLNIGGQERNKSLEENARRSEIIQKYFAYSSK